MNTKRETDFGSELSKLAKLLQQCPQVTRYDSGTEKEAWTLAHDLLDLQESCRAFTEGLLPKLLDSKVTPEERFGVLVEVGEELRHMLYHIKDSRFYKYVSED